MPSNLFKNNPNLFGILAIAATVFTPICFQEIIIKIGLPKSNLEACLLVILMLYSPIFTLLIVKKIDDKYFHV